MRPATRSCALFVGRAALLVLALALAWPWVAPQYSRLVAGLAGAGFELRGMTVRLEVDEHGDLQAEELTLDRRGRPLRVLSRYGLRGSWEGVVLLAALFLATPRMAWRPRLLRLAVALALLAAYHALYAVAYFSQALGHRVPVPLWYPFSEVWAPILLWAALSFRAWFPQPPPEPSRQPA